MSYIDLSPSTGCADCLRHGIGHGLRSLLRKVVRSEIAHVAAYDMCGEEVKLGRGVQNHTHVRRMWCDDGSEAAGLDLESSATSLLKGRNGRGGSRPLATCNIRGEGAEDDALHGGHALLGTDAVVPMPVEGSTSWDYCSWHMPSLQCFCATICIWASRTL